jgi:hypothetical protein
MARPPSVRRPTLEVYARQVARINERQARDIERAKLYREMMNETDPKHEAILAQLEEKADLTEKEEAMLLNAATVAQKLERVADNDKDDEKVPAAKRAAALDALEQSGPPKVTPAGGDEEPH